MWRATFKSLLAKKLRLVLTAISVVLGVGFVAGTYVLTDTMNAAFDAPLRADLGRVRRRRALGVRVRLRGGGARRGRRRATIVSRCPTACSTRSASVDGVDVAVGDVQGYAQMVDPATDEVIGGVGPPTIGTNWNELAGGVADLAGREPAAGGARRGRDRRGDGAQRRPRDRRPHPDPVPGSAGRVHDRRASPGSARPTTSAARRSRSSTPRRRRSVLGKEGVYDAISVVGDEGVAACELRSVGRRGAARRRRGGHVDVGRRRGVAGAAGGAGVLPDRTARVRVRGAVRRLVHHLQHVLDHRRAAHARARPAASARRVAAAGDRVGGARSVPRRAWSPRCSASSLGIGIAVGLQGLLAAFNIDLPSTALQLLPRTIVVVAHRRASVVTVVASILPARRAARGRARPGPPRGGRQRRRYRPRGAPARRRARRHRAGRRPRSSTGCSARETNGASLVGLGAAVTFIGVAMLSPLAARPVAGGLGAPLRRLSIQARLGRENAMRSPRRTASTAAALMIGLGLVSMVAILAASLKASFDAALTETLRGRLHPVDQLVHPVQPRGRRSRCRATRGRHGVARSVRTDSGWTAPLPS